MQQFLTLLSIILMQRNLLVYSSARCNRTPRPSVFPSGIVFACCEWDRFNRVMTGTDSTLSEGRLRVCLYRCESDFASRWIHGESYLMFTLSSTKDRKKNSLLLGVTAPKLVAIFCFCRADKISSLV